MHCKANQPHPPRYRFQKARVRSKPTRSTPLKPPPMLSDSTRDVISSLPEEISSQSTCEYVESRTSKPLPHTNNRRSAHAQCSKIRSPKSRRKSCAPCALAKCKCDLQQPCSCCIAKKKECTFADSKSVTAVKVIPADVPDRIITPSASSDIIFTPDSLIPSNPKSCASEKSLDDRYSLDVSSNICLAAPSDLMIADHNWLDDTGQFVDQFSSPCFQDMFFDWNVPAGCGPLDFTSTFSPMYASMETTPFGIVSDPSHIVTPSAYLEPANTPQTSGEMKRYCTLPVPHTSAF